MTHMNSFTSWDFFIISSILFLGFLGFIKGITRSFFGFLSWVFAFISTALLSNHLPYSTPVPHFLILALCFLCTWVLGRWMGSALASFLARIGLGSIDRLVGACFGVGMACLLIGITAWCGQGLDLDKKPSWRSSVFRPQLDFLVTEVNRFFKKNFYLQK